MRCVSSSARVAVASVFDLPFLHAVFAEEALAGGVGLEQGVDQDAFWKRP